MIIQRSQFTQLCYHKEILCSCSRLLSQLLHRYLQALRNLLCDPPQKSRFIHLSGTPLSFRTVLFSHFGPIEWD